MAMTLTTRVRSRLQRTRPGVGQRATVRHWIFYLVVGSLVTIYLWTPAALRASVSSLEWGSLAVLGWMYAMACGPGTPTAVVAYRVNGRNVKAVRT
jgi:hypothetical protein